MDRESALLVLRQSEPALRQRGVVHAALFGSVARNEAQPSSDVDIIVELEAETMTVFDYVGLKAFIATLFDKPVDVVNLAGLKPHVWGRTRLDVVRAF